MRHLMTDIETMSTHTSEALVLSAGAIPFELKPDAPLLGTPEIWILDAGPQLLNRHVSQSTQDFWRRQSRDAQRHWTQAGVAKIHPSQLGQCLRDFVSKFTLVSEVEIWANGDRFDIANLENLIFSYQRDQDFNLVQPWRYNGVSDYRTLCRWTPKLREMPADLKFEGHDPLEDCRKQIWRLWEVATEKMMDP